MPLGAEVGLSQGDIVLDGDPSSPKRGQQPPLQFSAHVYCGQTAGWIKIPLGTEVGLGTGHIVLDGDPAPPKRGTAPAPSPIFGPCLLWPNDRQSQLLLSTCIRLRKIVNVVYGLHSKVHRSSVPHCAKFRGDWFNG